MRAANVPIEVVQNWLCEHEWRLRRAGELALAVRDPDGVSPCAAILDIDEVLLCNVFDQEMTDGRRVGHLFDWPAGCWPHVLQRARDDQLCPAMPGAVELLRTLADAGMSVHLVTGRRERLRAVTLDNLEQTDMLPWLGGARAAASRRLHMLPDAGGEWDAAPVAEFKERVRAAIGRAFTIALCVGDQYSDLGAPAVHNVLCPHGFYITC